MEGDTDTPGWQQAGWVWEEHLSIELCKSFTQLSSDMEKAFAFVKVLHMSVPICGLALIDVMMWEWKNIALQSFTHIMQTFVAAAITKAVVIISY